MSLRASPQRLHEGYAIVGFLRAGRIEDALKLAASTRKLGRRDIQIAPRHQAGSAK